MVRFVTPFARRKGVMDRPIVLQNIAAARNGMTERLRAFKPGPGIYPSTFCAGAAIASFLTAAGALSPETIGPAVMSLAAAIGVNQLAAAIGNLGESPPSDPAALTEQIAAQVQAYVDAGGDDAAADVGRVLQEFGALRAALETWREADDARLRGLLDELQRQPQLVADQTTRAVVQALDPRLTSIEEIVRRILAAVQAPRLDIKPDSPTIFIQNDKRRESDATYDIFLSYAHADAAVVEELACRLDDAGYRVWLDKWILVPGEHWQQQRAVGLRTSRVCGICVGKKESRGWFREETERALNRQTRDAAFRVIPLILPGADQGVVGDFLELRTWVDFTKGLGDADAFYDLECGIKGIPRGRRPQKDDADCHRQIRAQLSKLRQVEDLAHEVVVVEIERELLRKWLGI
jgi:hypothetical protein